MLLWVIGWVLSQFFSIIYYLNAESHRISYVGNLIAKVIVWMQKLLRMIELFVGYHWEITIGMTSYMLTVMWFDLLHSKEMTLSWNLHISVLWLSNLFMVFHMRIPWTILKGSKIWCLASNWMEFLKTICSANSVSTLYLETHLSVQAAAFKISYLTASLPPRMCSWKNYLLMWDLGS